MKIVIVGSEGFIGRTLKKKCLEKGIQCTTIDTVSSGGPNHYDLDLRSESIVDAIPYAADALVDLAAISRNQACRDNPQLAFDVNVTGALNLFKAATERNVKQFIFASTDWVYGDANGNKLLGEDQVIEVSKIETQYALTKLAAEQSLRLAYAQGSCAITVLRFGIVYGPPPNNWGAIESLFSAVRTEDTIEVGSLDTARRFIHISDVTEGICSAIGSEGFDIFNLNGDQLLTLKDIITQSSEILKRWPTVSQTDPSNPSIRNPNNEKAGSRFGWYPTVSLEAGLLELMAAMDGGALD